jgi:hypothetical protein
MHGSIDMNALTGKELVDFARRASISIENKIANSRHCKLYSNAGNTP